MNIDNYKILISNLPVRQQSFTTKRNTWRIAESKIDWLADLNDKLFDNKEALNISRQDIFNSNNSIRELILKTIYWGYTSGMRGNNFVNILQNIHTLETAFRNLKGKENLTSIDFNDLTKAMKNVSGLGLSTYSKLLYFLDIKFDDNPCLILDQRLIDVFANKVYDDFSLNGITYSNAQKRYLDFLKLVNKKSLELGTPGENVEQFLFMFGNNLKLIK